MSKFLHYHYLCQEVEGRGGEGRGGEGREGERREREGRGGRGMAESGGEGKLCRGQEMIINPISPF